MTETQKKGIEKEVVIALVAWLVLLAFSTVHFYMTYQNYVSTHSHTDSEYDSLQSAYTRQQSVITSFAPAITSLSHIVSLKESAVWVNNQTVSQSASSYAYWTPAFSASYAGYVSVNVQSSTTNNTYVEVIWSTYGVNYDNSIVVGTSGTAVFPVLPSSTIQIRIGNTNLVKGAIETATITYYY